jgi:hypothetical protein
MPVQMPTRLIDRRVICMAHDRIGTGPWAWLKAVGTQEDPLKADWRLQDAQLLDRVWFSKHPRSIRGGDLLVYYAARHGLLTAIGEVGSDDVVEDLEEERWKWSMAVRPIVTVGLRQAPALSQTSIAPTRVRRQSHIKIEAGEYGEIRELLLAAAADSSHLPDD